MKNPSKHHNPTMSPDSRIVVARNQVSADIGDEIAVLNLNDGVDRGLNDVGACVWDFVREPRSFREIVDHIQSVYDVDAGTCHDDLLLLLDKLIEADLIETKDEHSG